MMSADELKSLDKLNNLNHPHFSGTPLEDAQVFLDCYYEILCNLGLVVFNGVDFTAFRCRVQPRGGRRFMRWVN